MPAPDRTGSAAPPGRDLRSGPVLRPNPGARLWRLARHLGGFLLAGTLAFLTDAGLFQALHGGLGLDPLLARPPAIAVAMVVSWLLNRTLTFPGAGPPRLAELLRFAGVAWTSAALNYAVFAGLLLALPRLWPLAALALSSIAAMTFAYLGMRLAVFRR